MPDFDKPGFAFTFDVKDELKRLRNWKAKRAIPDKQAGRVLVATWNVANFGTQEREDRHLQLIAEVMSWFDIVAVQELKENFGHLDDVARQLGPPYKMLFSDSSGNGERMGFLYDSKKLRLLEEIGEIAFPAAQLKNVKLPGVNQTFDGFDRTPYLAAFQAGKTSLMMVNVHLFFGSESARDMNRRALETFAVAKWARARQKSKFSFARNVFAMGDFNMPKKKAGDPVFDALTKLGLELPAHSSEIGSNLSSDRHYDQIAYFPGESKNPISSAVGIFDFDGAIFPTLWKDGNNVKNFRAYLRYYISDHRPMWIQLRPT